MTEKIMLSHGDGGVKTNELIRNVFLRYYGDENQNPINDAFIFSVDSSKLAFTTDSFVVNPLFFRGGNIGKLAVCGTINDLATAGAKPLYLSVGFIIEESFDIENLCKIAESMGKICRQTGVKIVTGDTKVVEKGSVDGLFINTSGIGVVSDYYTPCAIEPGDEIIVSGTIAEHGTTILLDRYKLEIETDIISDCCPLNDLVSGLDNMLSYIKLMKDPTRGGVATVLNEISVSVGYNVELIEEQVPINNQVKAINNILGIDPLYLACEGRMIFVVKKGYSDMMLRCLKEHDGGKNAKIIGCFTSDKKGVVYLKTSIGGKRIIPSLEGQTVPRIC